MKTGMLCLVVAVSLAQIPTETWASQSKEIRLNAGAMEREGQLVNIRFDRAQDAIVLDAEELIEDDAPATGVPERFGEQSKEWIEGLHNGIVLKKILVIEDPRAVAGQLILHGNETKGNKEPLHISVNGVEIIRPAARFAYPFAKQYIDYPNDRWIYVDFPASALTKGKNEILLWTNSEADSWYVLISPEEEFARGSLTRIHHPNRSLKSTDGGKTWTDSRLGPNGLVDGEYSIRMSLDRRLARGVYVSSVIDMIDNGSTLKRKSKIERWRSDCVVETPKGTSAQAFARFGASSRIDDASWTDWQPLNAKGSITYLGERRFVQWKIALSTDDPLVSPKIRAINLSVEWADASSIGGLGLTATALRNGRVLRSSYGFGYENLLHPELERFRKNGGLEKIVAGATTEFEAMMRLLHWAYRIPVTCNQYSWNWNDVVQIDPGDDGLPRLQRNYTGRRRDAMCLYSNQALIGALLAMGHQARHVNVHSEGRAGHEVVEVWSNDFNKWIYLDATRDYYYFDPETGVPLNALEIHQRMAPLVPQVETWQRPFIYEWGDAVAEGVRIGIREGDNAFSSAADGRMFLARFGHMRIIPRNDFLSHPRPVPVHTGASMWGWDGFLNFYDGKFPKRPEYQRYSSRALDFYEPLNQAEVFLYETNERGILEIDINTFTPSFECCLVRLNGGKWLERKTPRFRWKLERGINRVEARTRNARGVIGPLSTLEVTYHP